MDFTEKIEDIKLKHIHYDNLVRITIPSDMNCFFHAILRAFNKLYNNLNYYSDRYYFVKAIREALANSLTEINPYTGKILYDSLPCQYREFSKVDKTYNLENMINNLKNNMHVGDEYLELISEKLGIDIYIINFLKEDVYNTGRNIDTLYKNRKSIFLLYIHNDKGIGHFEVLGLKSRNNIDIYTLFDSDHEFTILINSLMRNKIR